MTANPYPEDRGPDAKPSTETWIDISGNQFEAMIRAACDHGGKLETNARGSDLLYLGTRSLNGHEVPRLIAVRHGDLAGLGTRKIRANAQVLKELT